MRQTIRAPDGVTMTTLLGSAGLTYFFKLEHNNMLSHYWFAEGTLCYLKRGLY